MTRRKSFLSPSVGEMYSLKRKRVSTMPSAWRWRASEASAKLSASRRNLRLNSLCALARMRPQPVRSEEHTSELQSRLHLVCRLLLEKKKKRHVNRSKLNMGTTN